MHMSPAVRLSGTSLWLDHLPPYHSKVRLSKIDLGMEERRCSSEALDRVHTSSLRDQAGLLHFPSNPPEFPLFLKFSSISTKQIVEYVSTDSAPSLKRCSRCP